MAYDIETSPNLGYFWGLWKQNIGLKQLIDATEMLSFGAQWVTINNGKIIRGEYIFATTWQIGGRRGMVQKLWELFDEADVVMGWNNKSFDDKHVTREFIEHDLSPPKPYHSLDLMQKVKGIVRLPSNKLDYVLSWLGIEQKYSHSGFDMWLGVMRGEKKYQDMMETYQRHDVENKLVGILERILPFIELPVNVNLYTEGYDVDSRPLCRKCGGKTNWDGYRYTKQTKFRQYKCKSCGSYGRHRLRAAGASAY